MSIYIHGFASLVIAAAVSTFSCGCLYEPYPPIYEVKVTKQEMPAEVSRSFARRHPDAILEAIKGFQFKGRITEYTLFFAEGGQRHRVTIDPSGRVLVPAKVYTVFENQHPKAVIISISRYDEGHITRYMVLFEDDGQRHCYTQIEMSP